MIGVFLLVVVEFDLFVPTSKLPYLKNDGFYGF